jgi:hypothetical protein
MLIYETPHIKLNPLGNWWQFFGMHCTCRINFLDFVTTGGYIATRKFKLLLPQVLMTYVGELNIYSDLFFVPFQGLELCCE